MTMHRLASPSFAMLLAPVVISACGGSPRAASTPTTASTSECQERIQAAMRDHSIVEPDSPIAKKRDSELIWLANNCSTHDQSLILGGPTDTTDGLRAAWDAQVDAHPSDESILGNAAALYEGDDDKTALALYRRAEAADPDDMRWAERQAVVLARTSDRSADPQLAEQAYAKFERAATLASDANRFDLLGDLAKSAFAAKRLDDAKRHAEEILAGLEKRPQDWNTGNLTHDAYSTLGRVALAKGDVAAAKAHLLAAGKTPGSPQLNSFGPDFELASELLAVGERATVDEYLVLVAKFWEMGDAEITNWRAQLARGESPRLR